MNDPLAYWRRTVGHCEVYRYHLEKAGHSLLIGAVLAGLGIYPLTAVTLAVVGYLVIGKLLVGSRPSKDWIADLLIGSLAIVAVLLYLGDPFALVALLLWVALYVAVVLDWRWASP